MLGLSTRSVVNSLTSSPRAPNSSVKLLATSTSSASASIVLPASSVMLPSSSGSYFLPPSAVALAPGSASPLRTFFLTFFTSRSEALSSSTSVFPSAFSVSKKREVPPYRLYASQDA